MPYERLQGNWGGHIKRRGRKTEREYHLERNYGISKAEYIRMLLDQEGVCAICKQPPTKKELAVDHDHKTNKVRGLLCIPCNLGLGYFKDNPELVRTAANYLDCAVCTPPAS